MPRRSPEVLGSFVPREKLPHSDPNWTAHERAWSVFLNRHWLQRFPDEETWREGVGGILEKLAREYSLAIGPLCYVIELSGGQKIALFCSDAKEWYSTVGVGGKIIFYGPYPSKRDALWEAVEPLGICPGEKGKNITACYLARALGVVFLGRGIEKTRPLPISAQPGTLSVGLYPLGVVVIRGVTIEGEPVERKLFDGLKNLSSLKRKIENLVTRVFY